MSRSEAKTASSDHLAIAILLLLAAISIPGMALAADDACAGISQKCTTDTTYDKTIGGTVYSCYDCKQALCKDGGNGGLSGTKTSSVCTEKATIFQPISPDGKFGGAGDQHLAPKPRPKAAPGDKLRLRADENAGAVQEAAGQSSAPIASPAARGKKEKPATPAPPPLILIGDRDVKIFPPKNRDVDHRRLKHQQEPARPDNDRAQNPEPPAQPDATQPECRRQQAGQKEGQPQPSSDGERNGNGARDIPRKPCPK